MTGSLADQTLAFCGTLQAGELVRQIATGGHYGAQAARTTLDSLFVDDPGRTAEVWGGVEGLRLGLAIAGELAGRPGQDALAGLAYASGLLRLSRILWKDGERQRALGRELDLVRPAWERADDPADPSVVAQLADIYRSTISTMSTRIEVRGNAEHLKQGDKVALIRALLLGGVRSGFLWIQLGGRPWRLLFQRRKMFALAREMAERGAVPD